MIDSFTVFVPLPLQTPPRPLIGFCPPTTITSLWSTAALTLVCSIWSLPGSSAGSPPCLRKPSRSCTVPCRPLESTWTGCSPPTRMQVTAVPCTSRKAERRSGLRLQAYICVLHILVPVVVSSVVHSTVYLIQNQHNKFIYSKLCILCVCEPLWLSVHCSAAFIR